MYFADTVRQTTPKTAKIRIVIARQTFREETLRRASNQPRHDSGDAGRRF